MIQNCLNLEGRVAVVIGASSGLGLEIATGLARHGADVVPTGRRQEWLEKACQSIEDAGRKTLRQPIDVTDRGSIDALRDAVLLASDGASFITGQCLAVDGGYLASGVNS